MDAPAEPEARAPRRPRRRVLRRILLVAAAIVAVFVLWSGYEAFSARQNLLRARATLSSARAQIDALNVDGIASALATARASVARAHSDAHSFPLSLIGNVPIAGRTLRAVQIVTDASSLAIDSGGELLSAAHEFPQRNGRIVYSMRGGAVDVSPWMRAEPSLRRAHDLAQQADALVGTTPRSLVVGAGSIAGVTEKIDELARLTRSFDAVSTLVPQLFGTRKTSRILLLLQNPAEARATGGLIGGFTVIDVRDGTIRLHKLASDRALDESPTDVPMPAWYRARYDRFGSRYLWSNADMEADFRITGPLLADLFKRTTGIHVDSVLSMTPETLSRLLAVTGRIRGPGSIALTSASIGKLIMHDQYLLFSRKQQEFRRAFLTQAMAAIWSRILGPGFNLRAAARAIAASVSAHELMLWTSDARGEAAAAEAGASGAFVSDGAFAGAVDQNASGSKVEYYLRRDQRLDVTFDKNRSAHFTLTVALHNTAPDHGQPSYIIGPDPLAYPADPPGRSRSYFSLYLPGGAQVSSFTVDGVKQLHESEQGPYGSLIVSRFVIVEAGRTLTIQVGWTLPDAWSAASGLDLTLFRQPLASPDQAHLVIHDPPGSHWTVPAGWRRVSDSVAFDGTFDSDIAVALSP